MTEAEIASGILFELFTKVINYHEGDKKALDKVSGQREYVYSNLVAYRKAIDWAFEEGGYKSITKSDIPFILEDYQKEQDEN